MDKMVVVQRTDGSEIAEQVDESEITEQDALRLTMNLLRISIYSISYRRGMFPKNYFSVESDPLLEMKVNMLMPMDAESRSLIDCIEKGVREALHKKHLKTLLFCICKKDEGGMIEEYAFSFLYPSIKGKEVTMSMSCGGLKENKATYKSNAAEATLDHMRSSARKMIQSLISVMITLDPIPAEQTILMKLMYNDHSTPVDNEPSLFKFCADNEAIHTWKKNPSKMELGSFNSKYLLLTLKVKSLLDLGLGYDDNANYSDDDTTLENESYQDDECSVTDEVFPSEEDHYVVAPDDNSQLVANEDLTSKVRHWICSGSIGTTKVSDFHSRESKALYDAFDMDQVTMAKLQGDGEIGQSTMRKLIVKMVQEGIVKNSGNQRSGHSVVQSESSNTKLLEIDKMADGNEYGKTAVDTNTEHAKLEYKSLG